MTSLTNNFTIHIFQSVIGVLDIIVKTFFPGVPTVFGKIQTAITYTVNSGVIGLLKHWLSIVYYFIPYDFVSVFLVIVASVMLN